MLKVGKIVLGTNCRGVNEMLLLKVSMFILKDKRLPCPPPGHLPDSGIKPTSPAPPALAGGFFTTSATCEAGTGAIAFSQGNRPLCVCDVISTS